MHFVNSKLHENPQYHIFDTSLANLFCVSSISIVGVEIEDYENLFYGQSEMKTRKLYSFNVISSLSHIETTTNLCRILLGFSLFTFHSTFSSSFFFGNFASTRC